jgi:hypothetical protein
MIVAAAGIYPDQLAYFNEASCLVQGKARQIGFDGGTACGPLWLDDSNVDWGQGLKQLKIWLDKNAHGRSFQLGYFGTYPPGGIWDFLSGVRCARIDAGIEARSLRAECASGGIPSRHRRKRAPR